MKTPNETPVWTLARNIKEGVTVEYKGERYIMGRGRDLAGCFTLHPMTRMGYTVKVSGIENLKVLTGE